MAADLFDHGDGASPARPLSLVRLSSELARSFAAIGRVSTEGEVTKPYVRGGRIWFELRDRAALIRVHCPASAARRSRVVEGERVRVTGRIEWRASTGTLQLLAEEVMPTGEGAIAAMIEAARRSLRADGILDRPRRPLPLLPGAVGVVCGVDAAVLADIKSVVAAVWPGYPLIVATTTVSGGGASRGIEEALRHLDGDPMVDVIILARGGGSPSDLAPWSDETLCRAVGAASSPVVAAIGHEDDRPLVDEVADHRFGTPSLAAAAVIPDRGALQSALDDRLAGAHRRLDQAGMARAVRLERADVARPLGDGVARAGLRIERARSRLAGAHPSGPVRLARQRLDGIASVVAALSPARTLERGYAVVRRRDGSVVRDLPDIAERLEIEVAAGRFVADVTGSQP